VSFFSDERSAELRELFFESASELLQILNEEGLKLEKNPSHAEILREVRRTVHTLKGDSAGCGYRELSELAHALEDILTPETAIRSGAQLADLVLKAADKFAEFLAAYRSGSPLPDAGTIRHEIQQLVGNPTPSGNGYKLHGRFEWTEYEQLTMEDAVRNGQSVYNIAVAVDPACQMPAAAVQMLRSSLKGVATILASYPGEADLIAELDVFEAAVASKETAAALEKKCYIPAMVSRVLVQPFVPPATHENDSEALPGDEDLLETAPGQSSDEGSAESYRSRTAASQSANRTAGALAHNSAPENTLRVDAEKIDEVLNLVGELIIGKSMLTQGMHEFDKRFTKDPLRTRFADAMAFQARILNDLQKSVMKIRMVPVDQLFRRFPRVVRDTARICGKEVQLMISGADTDLDKSILDALAEPLSHLVRNAIDHGLEPPEERLAAGKTSTGMLRLHAYHQGNQVIIECSDDGRGIDIQKIIAKAVEQNVISHEEAARISEAEALNLIFQSGLSTARQVTAVSGRGVGMDVVRTVLERLKGTVTTHSKLGEGTSFLLKVPLTLAIIKAMMFRVADRLYAVPLASVLEITRTSEHEIHRVDQHEVIQLREEVLTLVRLNKLAEGNGFLKRQFVVVVSLGDRKFGLLVDSLVGEEELVIKALDDHLVATELVSGASILGDGTVVLILNLSAVVPRFAKLQRIGATA
jgi:two-component system, chemotaxis family, sensor kinase CheA